MEYPKIHSLYKREGWYFNEKEKIAPQKPNRQSFIIGDYAQPEFANINKWRVEEKIDGTNIRIFYQDGKVRFGGRTKDAQLPTHLLNYLQNTFGDWNFHKIFPSAGEEPYPYVILFGEGYGPKIQKNGEKYRSDPGFVLFDCYVSGWWLKREDIEEIARKFMIPVVPNLGMMTENEIISLVKSKPNSVLAPEYGCIEGVVCKTDPVMLFRKGEPIMWKLKCKEFQ